MKGYYTQLILGKEYDVAVKLPWFYTLKSKCKFIRVTKKGYNMLNIETHKCIFKRHLYPNKEKKFFILTSKIKIT